ncbi:hypothetical protein KUTeg_005314 [Tegillarca granosa]|uniref:Uncharacterized protein n=1 Tax=Tegillarca granosa TaxID=220873 RepID=A0ABQ9FMB2_TEGGR|nr:hypothetical protein KUTeg_005314 [Tegillarca granosa]
MFPSMSVNVSMSMNVGMPTAINNGQYHPMHHHHHHQHWTGQQQPPTRALTPQYQHTQYNVAPLSPQYNCTPNHSTYPLTPELRSIPPCEGRNIFYRTSDNYKEAARCLCRIALEKKQIFVAVDILHKVPHRNQIK